MSPIILEAGRGRTHLRLGATPMGRDLCVTLDGGDQPHIGAVALSQARPSHRGEGLGASTSVLTLLGHKEDDLARTLAARLAVAVDGTVCVACGIHLDAIQPEELQEVAARVEQLTLELLEQLKAT
jgi:hypothetical protein